jgi:hypothetical protein
LGGDFAVSKFWNQYVSWLESRAVKYSQCYRLRCDSEPGIICHPYAFIVS